MIRDLLNFGRRTAPGVVAGPFPVVASRGSTAPLPNIGSLAPNLDPIPSTKPLWVIEGVGDTLMVTGAVSPITVPDAKRLDEARACAAVWDRAFAPADTTPLSHALEQILQNDIAPRARKFQELAQKVITIYDDFAKVRADTGKTLGSLLAPSPPFWQRVQQTIARNITAFHERLTGRQSLPSAFQKLVPSAGANWRPFCPNVTSLDQNIREDMQAQLAPYNSSPLSHLTILAELPALLPIGHICLLLSGITLRNPSAGLVATAVGALLLTVLLSLGGKNLLAFLLTPWFMRGRSLSARLGPSLCLLPVAATTIGWYSMDLAYLVSQINARRIKIPLDMAPFAALFFVSLAFTVMLYSALKQARYNAEKATKLGEVETVARRHSLAIARLPQDASEGELVLQETLYAGLSFAQSLAQLRAFERGLNGLPRTPENYRRLLEKFHGA